MMDNKLGFFVLLAVLSLAFAPFIKVYLNEPISKGKENEVYVSVNNGLGKNFEDTQVRIFIYELGVTLHSNNFDLEGNSNVLTRFYWRTPKNIPAGDYIARVEVSNSRFKDWRYIYLPVR